MANTAYSSKGTLKHWVVQKSTCSGQARGTTRKGTYHLVEGEMWDIAVANAPLNKRGWVLQERLLSPCVLHFGHEQVLWECSHSRNCEAFPRGLPDAILTSLRFKSIHFYGDEHNEHQETMENRDEIFHDTLLFEARGNTERTYASWHSIIEAYSVCKLTRPEDKLVALSGAAKEISQILRDRYLAGLWKSNLLRDLLWRLNPLGTSTSMSLSLTPRAPSWSWASLDASISYDHAYQSRHEKMHSALVECFVRPCWDDDTGMVDGSYICLKGPLLKALGKSKRIRSRFNKYWVSNCMDVEIDTTFDFPSLASAEEGTLLHVKRIDADMLDISVGENFANEFLRSRNFYFVPIRTDEDSGYGPMSTYGLILSPSGTSNGEYVRVGAFRAEESASGWMMMPCEKLPRNAYEECDESNDLLLYTIRIV